MPYIKREDYQRAYSEAAVPGELNFALTSDAIDFFQGKFSLHNFEDIAWGHVNGYLDNNGTSYTNYNNVIGALVCCGFELSRRLDGTPYMEAAQDAQLTLNRIAFRLYHDATIPYEDTKIEENGDVFPAWLFEGGKT